VREAIEQNCSKEAGDQIVRGGKVLEKEAALIEEAAAASHVEVARLFG
jgi:hypothetical protein